MLGQSTVSSSPISSSPVVSAIFGWYQPMREPVRATPQNASGLYVPPDTTRFAENVSIDRWMQPLSLPVLRIPQAAEGFYVKPTMLAPIPFGWFQPWREPVRLPYKYDPTVYIIPPRIITNPLYDMQWLQPWREPVRLTPFIRQNFDPISWCQPPIIPPVPVPGKVQLSYQNSFTLTAYATGTSNCALAYQNSSTLTFSVKNTSTCTVSYTPTSTLTLLEEPI